MAVRIDRSPLLCEIRTSSAALAADLERVVAFCASKAGLEIAIVTRPPDESTATIVLQIPAHLAAVNDAVWCFVCRLACLCPQARVGALVPAADAFASGADEAVG
jgi:hypothetical protein